MIIVDHMPGNPWEDITLRNLGFSDAAEAFFVMSGIAAGIAYSPTVDRWLHGELRLWDALAPMWRRAWTLYTVQILLTVMGIAIFAWATSVFYRAEFRTMHNLQVLYTTTGPALVGLATLGYQMGYVNILPTYIVLLLASPFIIAAGLRAPWLTLITSAALWFFAGANGWNIPYTAGSGVWFFSPLAWQLIFVVGLMIGIRHRRDQRLVPVSWPLFYAALAFLVFVFAWRHNGNLAAILNHGMAQIGSWGAPGNIVSHNKTILALPRLLHVLALVYVLSCLPVVTRVCAHRWAAPLRLMGGHGLLVFGLGTVLALCGQVLMFVEPDMAVFPWTLPIAAVLLTYIAARIAEAARRKPTQATA